MLGLNKRYQSTFRNSIIFEVTWCLLVAGVLGIRLEKSDIPVTDETPGSIVPTLLAMLRDRKLLELPLSTWHWRAELRRHGVYGVNWLPLYEAVRRGWTSDNAITGAVKAEPILSRALTANVAFVEDRIFSARRINLTKRTFRPKKSGPSDVAARVTGGQPSVESTVAHPAVVWNDDYDTGEEFEETEDTESGSVTEGYEL